MRCFGRRGSFCHGSVNSAFSSSTTIPFPTTGFNGADCVSFSVDSLPVKSRGTWNIRTKLFNYMYELNWTYFRSQFSCFWLFPYLTPLTRYSWPRRRWARHRGGWGPWWWRPGGPAPCSCCSWSWPSLHSDVCHLVSTLSPPLRIRLKHVLYLEKSSLIQAALSEIIWASILKINIYLWL